MKIQKELNRLSEIILESCITVQEVCSRFIGIKTLRLSAFAVSSYKILFPFLFFLFSFLFEFGTWDFGLGTSSYAQPANDNCSGAQNLGTLGAPANCGGGGGVKNGATTTVAGTTVGATSENPYTTLVGCGMASPAIEVWYKYVAPANGYGINIAITGATFTNPNIALWMGTNCNSLAGQGCIVGSGSSATLNIGSGMIPGQTYYIQVSGNTATATGTFNLSVNAYQDCSDCLNISELTVTPLPTNGTYQPGQTVTFCFHISQYTQVNQNWLHGVQLSFGNGWDLTTLTTNPANALASCGNWTYYPNGITGGVPATSWPAGFYFDYDINGVMCQPNGNAGDNFGDTYDGSNGAVITATANQWKFCWTVTVKSGCNPGMSLAMTVNTSGDGESGAWSNTGCTNDPPVLFNAIISCCPPNISGVNVKCNGGSTGTATATPVGSASPYTYNWSTSPAQTTQTATGLSASTYTVTVTDVNLCSTTNTITLTQPSALSLSTSQVDPGCGGNNGSATVTATGGTTSYSYLWSTTPAQTTATATGLISGNYTVTVTDANNCTKTVSVTIGTNPPLTLSTSSTAVACNGGSNGTATVSASSGTTPYIYLWNTTPAQNTATATGLIAGNYSVTVTDNSGCQNNTTVAVNSQSAIVLSTSLTNVTCQGGNNGTASVTASGGNSPYTIKWNTTPQQTTATATGLIAGTYSVTVTDVNICSSSTTVTVADGAPNANATITPAGPFCTSSPAVNLTAATGGGTWTGTGITSATNGTFSPSTAGIGTHLITYSISTVCGDTDTVNIVVSNVTITSNNIVNVTCNGLCNGSITINATGASQYSINNGTTYQASNVFNNLCAGTYPCKVENAGGCLDSIQLTVTQPAAITLTGSSTAVTCQGGSDGTATVSAAGGTTSYSYLWNTTPSQTNATATGLSAATYTVTVTDANGCTKTTTVTVNPGAPSANATITPAGPFCLSSPSVNLTAATGGGTWTGTGITNAANGTFSPSTAGTGTHLITYSISTACGDTDTVNIVVSNVTIVSNNIVNVTCNSLCNGSITINATGASQYSINNGTTFQASNVFNNLCAGTYQCKVQNGGGCLDSIQLTITQPAAITLTTSSTAVTCQGGSDGTATVSAAGGTTSYTYSWNTTPAQTNATATGLGAGTYSVTVTDGNGCTKTTTVAVSDGAPYANATITPAGPFCLSSPPVNLTAATGGGTWTGTGITNSASGTFNPLTAGTGTHLITYSISTACGDTDTVNIVVSNVAFVSNTIVNTTCFGSCDGNITMNATGATQYSIDNGATFQSSNVFNNLCSGTYQCKVKNPGGCMDSIPVFVGQPTPVLLNFEAFNDSCYNSCNGYAVVIASGGTSPYNYLWTPLSSPPIGAGQGTASASKLCYGNYNLLVTDFKNCTSDTNFVINQPAPGFVTTTSIPTLCSGSCDGSATANAFGGSGNFSFQWDNNAASQTTQNATALCTGTYSVTATDANSCPVVTTVTVQQPSMVTVTVSPDTIICINATTQISANASGGVGTYTYIWDNGLPNGSFHSVNPAAQTCYTVFAQDGNGCQSAPQTVCVNIFPPLNVTALSDQTICKGDKVDLSAIASGGKGSGYSYSWNNGAGLGQLVTTYPPGDFPSTVVYVVTANDGCSPPATDSVTIDFYMTDTLKFVIDSTFGCAPYTVTFTNTTLNSLNCLWDLGDGTFLDNCGTFDHSYTNAGTYIVNLTVFSNTGCKTTLSPPAQILVNPDPLADFTFSPENPTVVNTLINFTNASSGQVTFWNWTFYDNSGNNNILGTSQNINPTYTFPADTGVFPVNLQVTTANGCKDDTTLNVIIDGEFVIYIPNAFTPNGDGKNDFFPPKGIGINPDRFTLYIFDRWGDIIFESHNLNDPWDGTAREQGGHEVVQEGVYVWKIITDDATRQPTTHKFIGDVTLLK